ncbi:hypothetical protein GEMMAAP_01945 [Gemmatimonas phototrophica]|uniref:Uncharacterized protein n=1 Tax=Gemmatimonas phototrophica TaxID=1379270 RepID=A0A143BFY9_9BACT|nr:hypothetical protein GEMMAAP_01945 [Gemmatimonas phototrophica]
MRKAGNRMRLAVQLVSVSDGYHLWSERFDRELTDVFAVQDEIAAAIAAKLQVTFVPPTEPSGRVTSAQVEAFELIAKGRALTAQRGRSLLAARECLERAIQLDPLNAEAHASLGAALMEFVRFGLLPVTEVRPLVQAALARALELDATMAAAMGTMGMVSLFLDHDPRAAFSWWERALVLQPRLVEVRASYALHGLLMWHGDDDERALTELARAATEDPRSAFCAAHYGVGLAAATRFSEATVEVERAYSLDPQAFLPQYGRVAALSRTADAARTVEAARVAFASVGRHVLILGWLTKSYVTQGDRIRAEGLYAELQARALTDDVSNMALALAADALGRVDEAITYALESVRCCDFTIPFWTRSAFSSDALRAHPRYPELLRAMGL